MSRAYRIRVSETLTRILRAKDHVSTQLEILEILPQDQMAELLEKELVERGFERDGERLVREHDGVSVVVEPKTGTVTTQAETSEEVDVKGNRETRVYDENTSRRKEIQEDLRDQLRRDLDKKADGKEQELQRAATERLEDELLDLRGELDQAVNRVTAEALKRKAASIGQIKEMTEDPESGSLTIVVEV
ncbi:MAG: hypothetical protein N2C14_17980 [Planctomycetales bacterium]